MEKSTLPGEAAERREPDVQPGDGIRDQGSRGFAFRISAGRGRPDFTRIGNGVYPQTYTARVRSSRHQRHIHFDAPHLLDPPDEPVVTPPTHEVGDSSLHPSASSACEPALPASIASGEKSKARDILAAIRTLKNIEANARPATFEEKQTLAKFAGFGPVALSIFPNPSTGRYKDAGWQAIGTELATLLSPEEYDSAKRTTFNAFYTSPIVIAAMHQAISRLGVPGDALVLEPGCGTGNFLALAANTMRFIGIELDSISGRIARALHPGHDIRIENFRDTKLPENRIDAVIGNVPFADLKLDYRGQRLSLHDYFFAKSIDALKPGGAMALVTTHYTLDKQNAAIRDYLASKADFVGAIRLPSDAFKREGTAVVTDIVFLRKRAAGEPAKHNDPDWLQVAPLTIEGVEIPVNRYFLNNPDMVLGTWSRKDTLYGGDSAYSVIASDDLAEQLHNAIRRLPQFATLRSPSEENSSRPRSGDAEFTPPPPLRHIGEGRFYLRDDRTICQIIDGLGVPVTYGGVLLKGNGTMTGKRLAALVGLRDHARKVLASQNEGWPEEQRQEERRELNFAYDRFVSAYGPINKTTFSETAEGTVIRRMPNLAKFREDPDAMLVMSLEEYDELTGKAAKAAIMKKDVVGNTQPITSVRTAEEGLLVSLNQHGTVDLPFIAQLYGQPEEKIVAELGDLIFRDPESKTWQTADVYLSGNVRAKLAVAEAAGSDFARNAEALRVVQPEDVLPGDIDANLGAPWIPASDIESFAAHLFQRRTRFYPYRPPEERRGMEHRCRLLRPAIRGRNLRLRYAARQRPGPARAGAQHEDADYLRHHIITATASSALSTRKRHLPPARSKNRSRRSSSRGSSPSRTAPNGLCASTTTPTTICVPDSSMARISISPA